MPTSRVQTAKAKTTRMLVTSSLFSVQTDFEQLQSELDAVQEETGYYTPHKMYDVYVFFVTY